MSSTHEVLRELEDERGRRQQGPVGDEAFDGLRIPVGLRRRDLAPARTMILVVSAIGLLLVGAWLIARPTQPDTPAVSTRPPLSAPAPSAAETGPTPVTTTRSTPSEPPSAPDLAGPRLLALDFEPSESGGRLVARLDSPTRYRVVEDVAGDDLVVLLPAARLAAPIAPLALKTESIRSLDVEQADGGLQLRLGLAEGTRTLSQLIPGDAGSLLVLDFHRATTAAAGSARATPAPKPAAAPARPPITAEPETAEPAEQQVVVGAPGSQQSTWAQIEIRSAAPASSGERALIEADALFREGHALAHAGRRAHAEQAFVRALEIAPAHHKVRGALALLLSSSGRSAEAIALLEVGRALDPGVHQLALLQARLLAEQGASEGALLVLQQEPPPIIDAPEYHAFLAAMLQRLGRPLEASQLYGTVLQIEPERPRWWMGLGISLEEMGRPDEALSAYQVAHSIGELDHDSGRFVQRRIRKLASGAE